MPKVFSAVVFKGKTPKEKKVEIWSKGVYSIFLHLGALGEE